jgi:SAM-dependent methyltransferase
MSIALDPLVQIGAVKRDLLATWSAGNYDFFSRFMEANATRIVRRTQITARESLLDVACGSGQVALIVAREGGVTHGCDIVPELVTAARNRAAHEGVACNFLEGDAEDLPYEDGQFDCVVSVYGAMFAPRPQLVARELLRVCRPGGRVIMANWTREGFVGDLLRASAGFIAPSGFPSPLDWGDEETVRRRFAGEVKDLRMSRQYCRFDYPLAPARVVDFYREYYGPTHRTFAALDDSRRRDLRRQLVRLWSDANVADASDHTTVDAEFLEVIVTKR